MSCHGVCPGVRLEAKVKLRAKLPVEIKLQKLVKLQRINFELKKAAGRLAPRPWDMSVEEYQKEMAALEKK